MLPHRLQAFALLCVSVVAGYAVRFAALHLPHVVSKYGGSALWAVAIYWLLVVLLPRWRPARMAGVGAAIATAVEFLKLYRSPAVDAFRLTLAGKLLLGRYFSFKDIVAYLLGIAAVAWLDARFLRRAS